MSATLPQAPRFARRAVGTCHPPKAGRRRKIDPTTVLFGDRARALLVARMAWWASTLGYSPGVCDLRAFQASAQAEYQHELATLTVGLGILGTKAVDVTDSQAKPPISPITFAM